jgi:glycerol-3-phosphate O-acyltransferase/dihydroxyacetone phosphate acyltransferase
VAGGSHDRTDLLPLKAGVSMMALGAMADHPNLQVKIVPVGLSYFHPHRFRSRAVVEFGSTLDVPAEFVEMYKEGGAKKREAVSKLLDLVYDALKTVTIRAPDYDTLMVRLVLLSSTRPLIWVIAANSSRATFIQDSWTAFNARPGC